MLFHNQQNKHKPRYCTSSFSHNTRIAAISSIVPQLLLNPHTGLVLKWLACELVAPCRQQNFWSVWNQTNCSKVHAFIFYTDRKTYKVKLEMANRKRCECDNVVQMEFEYTTCGWVTGDATRCLVRSSSKTSCVVQTSSTTTHTRTRPAAETLAANDQF